MDNVVVAGGSDSSDDVVTSEDMVEAEDSRSTFALASRADTVYFTVLISSSNGVRNDTLFSAGNSGLAEAILRDNKGAGLLVKMDRRLCGCLYGMLMVADSAEAEVRVEDRVEAELGVEALLGDLQLLSIDRDSFDGRPGAGAVGAR